MTAPRMTVHIAPVGNPLSDGGSSAVGHMWITIQDSFGNETSYGLGPAISGTAAGDGKISNNDSERYIDPPYNYSRHITEAQYEAVSQWAERARRDSNAGKGRWAEYNGVWNSCVDFSWEAINQAGIADTPESGWQGNILPWFNRWQLERRFQPDEITNPTILLDVSNYFRTAITPPRRDPLAIDLDGDGIETVGIPAAGTPILFDHDANGIKTGTGWLKGDDAWLVLDRDGNGLIDTGRELFGADTLITVTETDPLTNVSRTVTRNASTGFEALRTLDTGNGTMGSAGYGDGVFNASDAAFSQVKLWQDLNQDGISQSSELFTLADKGIRSISLNASTTTTDLGNGNTVTGQATVTRSNGSTTQIDSLDLQASNLNLANNPFYREFTDTIPLTSVAQALPEMGGSGVLRDLREAMSLGSPAAQRLTAAVQAFSAATTRDAQVASLDAVLVAWAETGPDLEAGLRSITGSWNQIATVGAGANDSGQGAFEALVGAAMDAKGLEWRGLLAQADFRSGSGNAATTALVQMAKDAGVITDIKEVNLGNTSVTATHVGLPLYRGLASLEGIKQRIGVLSVFNATEVLGRLVVQTTTIGGTLLLGAFGSMGAEAEAWMEQAYAALRDSVYSALAVQTRLKPYLGSINLVINEAGISFDFSPLVVMLDARRTGDERTALIDLVELNRYAQSTLQAVNFDGVAKLRTWVDAMPTNSTLRAELLALDVLGASVTTGSARTDIYLGDAGANSFSAGAGNDVLDGGAGNDTVYGDAGDDFLWGRDGNDNLAGGAGADTLLGGVGNDILSGETQYGGVGGNDVLDGGAGNDQLIGGGGSDTYLFGRGNGQDTIHNYSDGWSGIADPTVGKRDVLQFKAGILSTDVALSRNGDNLVLTINGSSDQVTINSYFTGDGVSTQGYAVEQIRFDDGTSWDVTTIKTMVLNGATAGNDTLTGYATADVMNGLAGNDVVYARDGNDTVNGGDGNDTLNGENGDDTLEGGQGADSLSGGVGADTLTGGAGNDNLYGDGTYGGNGGNDMLDGGAGNDQLVGGFGSDTYLFGRGDGQDTISNYADAWGGGADPTVGKQDVLQFKAGVLTSDVTLSRSGDSLVVKINGTSDQVTVSNYFVGDGVSTQGYALDSVRFADGTTWNLATVKSMVLQGTAGYDTVTGFAIADAINGLAGNDMIYARDGDDTVDGGDGNDSLNGENGNDMLLGGEGADSLYGGVGADTLTGGAGNDKLYGDGAYGGNGGNDVLDGGTGNDHLVGGFGSDTYLFGRGDGQDTISNYADAMSGTLDPTVAKQDVLQFKAGVLVADVLLSRSGDSLIVQIKGTSDQVTVSNYFLGDGVSTQGYALESLRFADGTSWSLATVKSMVLQGTAGYDTITGFATADTINGLAGNDNISGQDGDDTLNGGDGNDSLNGENGNDILTGGEGTDTLTGGVGADTLTGGIGNDNLYGDGAYGGNGGNDVLDGGTGNDQLVGGFGSDTYLFGRGDGQDTIGNYADAWNGSADPTVGKQDVLQFKAGVLVGDVLLSRSGDSLMVQIKGTSDQVTVSNYFVGDGVSTQGYALDSLRFADGTSWSLATVKSMVLQGSAGYDTISGFATADVINGLAGNDVIYARDGNDTVDGGDGNDTLNGDNGNDSLVGGEGADSLYGGVGSDTLTGGAGNDNLYGDGTYGGNGGNDVLDGGAGNDHLAGGYGSDTYLFGRGDGRDTISNYADGMSGTLDPTVGKQDVLQFKAGVLVSDVVLSRSGDSLIVQIKGTSDQVAVSNYFLGDGVSTQGYALESLRFADGTSWSMATVKSMVLQATAGYDTVTGFATADVINGLAGNDLIYAGDGNDTVDGGDGNDTLNGENGNDSLIGGEGADSLYGDIGADTLIGGAGNDNLYGDTFYGGNGGNDVLDGGAGNDQLVGGFGSDIYLFGRGDGQDTVSNPGAAYGFIDPTVGKQDVLQFKAGVLVSDVTLTRVGDNLVVKINGTADQVTINSYFPGNGASAQGYAVDRLRFDDGTSWDFATVTSKLSTVTTPAGATLSGTAAGETLTGGLGNDNLYGGAGNDTLDGGAGDDTLSGDAGNDTYLFSIGAGKDTISSYDSAVGKLDVVQLGAGITTADVTLSRTGDSLLLTRNGSPDSLMFTSYFSGDGVSPYAVEQIRFTDGTIWDTATVKSKVATGTTANDMLTGYATADILLGLAGDDTLSGRAGNDTLDGGAGEDMLNGEDGDDLLRGGTQNDIVSGGNDNDNLQGQEGNDVLYGGAGNDVLDGGAGNDTLSGDAGNDTYLFNIGSGSDTISSYDSTVGKLDVVQLGAGITTAGVTLSRTGDSLLLTRNGSADSLMFTSYFSGDGVSPYAVEQIRFADGTIWDIATVRSKVATGTTANDILTGYATADILSGLAGSDTVSGRAGNDTLDGGAGEDMLNGEDGDDILKGGTQNDILSGGNDNDNLQGQDGNDALYGGGGNDTLDGGTGDDTLSGDAGNDTYLFNIGSGKDTISSYDSTVGKLDVVQLGAGITTAGVKLVRTGDDLLLTRNGSADSLRFTSYFNGDGVNPYVVEQIKFADGTIWDVATVKGKVAAGTTANDMLTGYATADSLSGLAGADTLSGRAGNDTLDGGAGEDTLNGDDGDDVLKGGTQNDTLSAGNGNDNLQGQDGNDALYGGAGNDALDGGAGDDTLSGDAGNDTYLFNSGSGKDTISSYDSTVGKLDVVQLGTGITTAGVTLTRSGDDLQLTRNGNADSLRFTSYFSADGVNPYVVEQIRFADGTIWDIAAVKSKVATGTTANDLLTGYATADTLSGLAGADTLSGRAGNDTLDGGTGEDTLNGDDGDDILKGATDNDALSGGNGNDNLQGQDGNDTLYGGAGNDALDGGAGDDTLSGDAGNDTYLFNIGSGKDTISSYDSTVGKLDVVQLGAGITTTGVTLSRTGDDLLLTVAGSGDSLRMTSYFTGGGVSPHSIEQIKFADGVVWDTATVKASLLIGSAGDDVLTGYASADTLNGAGGNDVLAGGLGSDTYLVGRGSGADLVQENDATTGNTDVIQFGAGVAAAQIWFRQVNSDLEVSIIGTADKVTLSGWYFGNSYHAEQFKTSDGKTLLDSQVQSLVSAMAAFAPPSGQTDLPASYQTTLMPVIAANWGP